MVKKDSKEFLEEALEINKVDMEVTGDREERKLADIYNQIEESEKPLDPEKEELFIDNSALFEYNDISKEDKTLLIGQTLLLTEKFLMGMRTPKSILLAKLRQNLKRSLKRQKRSP